MSTQIETALKSLGDIFLEEIKSANERSEAAVARAETTEAQLKSVATILRGMVAALPTPANDTSAPLAENALPTKVAKTRSARNGACTDANLLDALSTEWTGAGKLHKLLTSRGFHISEGSVYNRLRKLCATYPDKVEAADKPERWRLKFAPVGIPREPEHDVMSKVARKSGKRKSVSTSPTASNDNVGVVHTPVLYHGDCLQIMQTIPDGSVDLILADLPYGVTKCSFDKLIPLNPLWEQYRRVIKPTGAIVLFAAQPFTSALSASNPRWLKYSLVWQKPKPSGFLQSKNRPLMSHEDILVFSPGTTVHKGMSKRRMTYNPQGVSSAGMKVVKARRTAMAHLGTNRVHARATEYEAYTGYPRSVLSFGKDAAKDGIKCHHFAKPLDLLEYLIRTYSNAGEMVLDNTMGSGSTCIAAMNTGRRSIGIEMDPRWFAAAQARISKHAVTQSDFATASHAVSSAPEEKIAEYADKKGARSNQNLAPSCNGQIAVSASTPSIVSPAIQLGKASLYTGDCLEVMRSMEAESVDLIFTSPPYNLGVPVGGRKTSGRKLGHRKVYRGYASHNDNMPHKNYVSWMRSVLKECWRLLRPDGAIFFNHKPRIEKLNLMTPSELNPDLPLRQIIIWNRKGGTNFNE
ncbi:site-specific DNA-methyltransferase, partial [Nostoc sp. CHAB 5834]|nr:site-specific DNA-methyltransferase [Nostoc sp. CHAB 5834]